MLMAAPSSSPPTAFSGCTYPWSLDVVGIGRGVCDLGNVFWLEPGIGGRGDGGLAIATAGVIIFYITFTFSYTELACAIPRAGGVFDYATRGLNRDLGFIAGVAQLIEFLFAPPAIAAAIGAYFHIFFPQVPVTTIAIAAYLVFTALNIYGVKAAAGFELVVTVLAVFELLLFSGVCSRISMAQGGEECLSMDGRASGRRAFCDLVFPGT